MNKRPIIIDTDPGVDDAIAIMLAASSDKLDIRAITPVTGNVQYELTSKNALNLAAFLGLKCKVTNGANNPLFIANKDAGDIHGTGGMAGYKLPESNAKLEGYAWDVIRDEAIKANGELEIITLGPLTNIAITLLRYPEIKPLIKRIVCMAGSGHIGNMNQYGEFNVWVDPDACEIVFKSGIPITMCGLDGNDFCGLYPDELREFIGLDTKISPLLDHIFEYFISRRFPGEPTQVINDAITMAYFIDENVGKVNKYHVDVETKSGLTAGWTIVDRYSKSKKEPNVNVLEWSDKELYKKMLKDMMAYYKK